jgi:electron transport complex protein RnfC
MACPPELLVPLDACRLGQVRLAVAPGQRVAAGAVLATAGAHLSVFSPADATVAASADCLLAGGPDGPYTSPALRLTELGPMPQFSAGQPAPDETAPRQPAPDWQTAGAEDLLERIGQGGLTTMTPLPQPLDSWCRQALDAKVDTLVANGVEGQPYLSAEHRLLVERGPEVVAGLMILARVLKVGRVVLAVDSRRTDRYSRVIRPARQFNVQPAAVLHKYPSGNDVLLTRMLTRREVPVGGRCFDVAVGVVNLSTCFAVHQWIIARRPLVARAVTVGGEGLGQPGNFAVPFGASAGHLLGLGGAPADLTTACHGGPMTGLSLPVHAVVGPGTNAVLALPADDKQSLPTACIRCAWCTDQCPVRLNVADLNDMYELGQVSQAARYDVLACVDCGVCGFVCPARLPLNRRMKELKRAVRETKTGIQHGV